MIHYFKIFITFLICIVFRIELFSQESSKIFLTSIKADIFDPYYNAKYCDFIRLYGIEPAKSNNELQSRGINNIIELKLTVETDGDEIVFISNFNEISYKIVRQNSNCIFFVSKWKKIAEKINESNTEQFEYIFKRIDKENFEIWYDRSRMNRLNYLVCKGRFRY